MENKGESFKIKLEFVGYLGIKGVKSGSYIQVEEGTTITDLLTRYGVKEEHQQYIIPWVNGRNLTLSYVLQANDSLYLLLPIGGG